jgi:hypothetical protein
MIIYIRLLEMLNGGVPCEWQCSTATRTVTLRVCLALMLLMQIQNAIVDIFIVLLRAF